MDRREFLIQSTSLALGAPTIAQGAARGRAAVRVAVVGTGGRGTDLIRSLSTIERAQIVGVCDDYRPHLEGGAAAAGRQAGVFTSYSTMLRETSPRAVIVATPLHLHFEMCMEAIDRGCDVFCEKTMCHTTEQARELAAAVRKRGTVFQVGLQRRANAIYRQAVAMVETGMLGRVTAIKSQWHRNNNWRRPVPVPRSDPAWPRLERRLNWRLYREYSRGLMTELASHQMDVATWFLGTAPRRAIGTGGIDYWRDGREVFDNVFLVYEYPMRPRDGDPYTVRVAYSSIQNNAFEGASELVMGTKGTLLLTERKGLFYREADVEEPGWSAEGQAARDAAIITSGKTLRMANDPWAMRGKPFEIDSDSDATRDELQSFLEAVQLRQTATVCDVDVGLVNTATAEIGDRAMLDQTAVELPAGITPRVA